MSKLRLKFPRRTTSWIYFLLALTIVVIAAMVYAPTPDYSKLRGPNPHETFYQYVALELEAPALDLPANEIATGYYYFILRMASADKAATNTRPAVAAARAKFLARVAALPSYH